MITNSFSVLKYWYVLLGSCIMLGLESFMPTCDISDVITRQVTNEALTIWALLDLAEHEHIYDQKLFYDALCQTTLKLCKEVQQLKESGYPIAEQQMNSLGKLFGHLHTRFRELPDMPDQDLRLMHAVDVILHYAQYFLKNNLGVETYSETTHSGF